MNEMKPTMPVNEKPKSIPRRIRRRTLFKLATLGVFIATLIPVVHLTIPALAYRDDLLALLNYSDDCHAPCFMGITPGVTTVDESVNILKQQDWIDASTIKVNFYTDSTDGYIRWENSSQPPDLHLSFVDFTNSTISEMIIFSDMPYITYIGLLGLPDFESTQGGLIYSQQGVNVGLPCGNNVVDAFTQDPYSISFMDVESEVLRPVTRWMANGCVYFYDLF
jgi:hypothetical protein